jgi:hypothetical protein
MDDLSQNVSEQSIGPIASVADQGRRIALLFCPNPPKSWQRSGLSRPFKQKKKKKPKIKGIRPTGRARGSQRVKGR